MFIICFLFLVSSFYFYFLIFYGLAHHSPPATRHPPPATRHPPPVTRHPPLVTRHPRKSPAVVQFLPKPSWLSSNGITTKNELSLYRESRETKDEKKWIRKINNITKKPGALSNKPLVRVYLT